MSSSNSAFNLQGAIKPNPKALNPLTLGSSLNSTPLTKALNSLQGGNQSMLPSGAGSTSVGAVGSKGGYDTAPKPSTPVKKVTNADGSSIEYHPETSGVLKKSSSSSSASTGSLSDTNPNASMQQVSGGTPGVQDPNYQPPTQNQNQPPTFPGIIGNLANIGNNGSQGYNQAVQNYKSLENSLANETARIETLPIGAGDQTGREAVMSRLAASKLAAAQGAINQQQTQQQQQIGALQGAGNLFTQTVQTPYGTPVYNFASGQNLNQESAGANGLNPVANIQSIAQQVINGQISPSQGYALGGNVSNFQGALNQAIQQAHPGFDTGVAQGKFDAKQSNTVTSGTAPTSAAADLYQSTYPQLAQLQTTTANIDQFGNLLIQNMNGINPSQLKGGNILISEARSLLSHEQQAQFDTTFAQLRAQIASLLQSGGAQIPTQITADANKVIDGSAPLNTLNATLERIKAEGKILTGNLQNQLNSAGSVIGAPKSGGSSSGDYQAYLKAIGQ